MKINNKLMKLLQQYGLKPPTLSDEVSTYAMLLITIVVVSGFFILGPAYTKLRDTNQEYNEAVRLTKNNEIAITNRTELQRKIDDARVAVIVAQDNFVKTQTDTEVLRGLMQYLNINGLELVSANLKPVPNTAGSMKSPFVVFQAQIEVIGTLNDITYFLDDLYNHESYKINKMTLRRLDVSNDPFECSFNSIFSIYVYTVVPILPE